jgi:hypothetical protein
MIGFIAPYTFTQLGTTGNTALSLFYTLYSSLLHTHALGFSVFTSRIQATDLLQSHWHFNSHMKSSLHSLIHFLPFLLDYLRLPSPELDPIPFLLDYITSRLLFSTPTISSLLSCQSRSYITTDGQPASLSWNKAPIWGLRPDLDYCLTVAGLLGWGALSDERTGLSFAIATGPRQRSHFWVRVP